MVVKETASLAVLEYDPTELNSSYCGYSNSSEQLNQTKLNKLNTQGNKCVRKYAYYLVRPRLLRSISVDLRKVKMPLIENWSRHLLIKG